MFIFKKVAEIQLIWMGSRIGFMMTGFQCIFSIVDSVSLYH